MDNLPQWAQVLVAPGGAGVAVLLLIALRWLERRLAKAEELGHSHVFSRIESAEKKANESSDKLMKVTGELTVVQVSYASALAEVKVLQREVDVLRSENERLRMECDNLRAERTELRMQVEHAMRLRRADDE